MLRAVLYLLLSLLLPVSSCPAQQTPELVKRFNETRQLAMKGDVSAQLNLGVMYDYGEGVPKDHAQAVFWYRRAAEQGNAVAQASLGYMYRDGKGVPKDLSQAAFWYRKASEQGISQAQSNLGIMYANGEGVPKDEIEAYAWLNLAAVSLGNAIKRRENLEKRMAPEAIKKAQARTQELQKLIEERKAAKGK